MKRSAAIERKAGDGSTRCSNASTIPPPTGSPHRESPPAVAVMLIVHSTIEVFLLQNNMVVSTIAWLLAGLGAGMARAGERHLNEASMFPRVAGGRRDVVRGREPAAARPARRMIYWEAHRRSGSGGTAAGRLSPGGCGS